MGSAFYLRARKYSLQTGVRRVYEDYHFILKEKDGKWSEKRGFSSEINIIDNPPVAYEHNRESLYLLQGYYLITNPYAEKVNKKTINKQEFNETEEKTL